MSFHINAKGDVGKCKASKGKCPFGSSEDHYGTELEGRKAYEAAMGADIFVTHGEPASNVLSKREAQVESKLAKAHLERFPEEQSKLKTIFLALRDKANDFMDGGEYGSSYDASKSFYLRLYRANLSQFQKEGIANPHTKALKSLEAIKIAPRNVGGQVFGDERVQKDSKELVTAMLSGDTRAENKAEKSIKEYESLRLTLYNKPEAVAARADAREKRARQRHFTTFGYHQSKKK